MEDFLVEGKLLNKYINLTIFSNAFYVIKRNYIIKTI